MTLFELLGLKSKNKLSKGYKKMPESPVVEDPILLPNMEGDSKLEPESLPISIHEKEGEEEEEVVQSAQRPNYDPTLDLRDYEKPSRKLLVEKPNLIWASYHAESNLKLPVILSDNDDQPKIKDLFELKTVFITGTQASGKTNLLNQFILSILFVNHPSQVKLILADEKGTEFDVYRVIERHFLAKLPGEETPIIRDPAKLAQTLNGLCIELDNRFELFLDAHCRDITDYNRKFIEKKLNPEKGHQFLPFIVFIVDDLSAFWGSRKELNLPLQRLINKGYQAGIFNIICTSQFHGEFIPPALLDSISSRLIFKLNNREDLRKFFGTVKINNFLETGEFIYREGHPLLKGKSVLIDYDDIEKICQFISNQRGYPDAYLLPEYVSAEELEGREFDLSDKDPLFKDAARLIVESQMGSTSLIQRRMKLGYNRAGRLMDQLEAAGVVGPNQGALAREVRIKSIADLAELLKTFN